MSSFVINGKEYKSKPFDFNLVCDLEDMGISLSEADNKPMSLIRAYFSICTGKGKEYAGKEMECHIINGGDFESLTQVMAKEMEMSDFFRNLNKAKATEVTEDSPKTRKKITQV